MSYFEFPHTRSYDGDLGYIIKKLNELNTRYNNFFEYNSIRFHDPINWDITTQYPAWNIVYDTTTEYLYISKRPVPLGIEITNTDFWSVVTPFHIDTAFDTESINPVANKVIATKIIGIDADIDALNSALNAEIEARGLSESAINARIDEVDSALHDEINSRDVSESEINDRIDTLANNLATEESERMTADDLLSARIDEITTLPEGSTTGDAELADIRITFDGQTYNNAGNAVRAQASELYYNITQLSEKQLVYYNYRLEMGGINSSGANFQNSNPQYMRFKDYIPMSRAKSMQFPTKAGGSSNSSRMVVYYDWDNDNNQYVFQLREEAQAGYQIKTQYDYVRITYYDVNGCSEELVRNWLIWPEFNGLDERFKSIESALVSDTVRITANQLEINMGTARYIFKRVTDAGIRIDTWRLFSGALITPDSDTFTMWSNSDAEGAIKITGENDFVSGYHGDEMMESIEVYLNGDALDLTEYTTKAFKNLTIYVKSNVYHCNTSTLSDQIAFIRYKKLVFEGDTVKVSNCYIAQSELSIERAALALFQCGLGENQDVFTNYSVNTDYKNYSCVDIATSKPAGSPNMTEATLNTIYANIVFKKLSGSDQRYSGFVGDFVSTQNRIKFYFDIIASTTTVNANEKIMSEFEFTIK